MMCLIKGIDRILRVLPVRLTAALPRIPVTILYLDSPTASCI